MSEEERYRKAWKDRSRRSLIAILLMVGGLIRFVILPLTFPSIPKTPLLICMVVWVLALIAAVVSAARFRCPRCNHRFSAHTKGARYQPYCTNCGLAVGAKP